jgi:hypothetical protein
MNLGAGGRGIWPQCPKEPQTPLGKIKLHIAYLLWHRIYPVDCEIQDKSCATIRSQLCNTPVVVVNGLLIGREEHHPDPHLLQRLFGVVGDQRAGVIQRGAEGRGMASSG